MELLNTLKKALIGGTWYVGIRDMESENKSYIKVQTPKGEWVADPFLFEENGKHFLFCEQYYNSKNKAGLSCYEIVNGEAVNGQLIIEEPYHMSYPCVFKYEDKYYMIPESSANDSIDLYEASSFPYSWTHKKTLLKGEKYVDTTVHIIGSKIYLLSYRKAKTGWLLVLFSLDIKNLKLYFVSSKYYESNIGRPAGSLFKDGDKLIRPAQLCKTKYGESILLYEVELDSDGKYDENLIDEIKVDSIDFPFPVNRIHTINRDSKYEVVDLFKEKIDIFRAFKIIKRAYFQK